MRGGGGLCLAEIGGGKAVIQEVFGSLVSTATTSARSPRLAALPWERPDPLISTNDLLCTSSVHLLYTRSLEGERNPSSVLLQGRCCVYDQVGEAL